VTGMETARLFASLSALDGLTLTPASLRQARVLLTARRILGYLSDPNGKIFLMQGGQGLYDKARLLSEVVRTYKGIGQIFRLKADSIAGQQVYYEDVAALVVFPSFTPADIISLTAADVKLPTGITRHLIPGRALRLNFDLNVLLSDRPLEEKNRMLYEFIHRKLVAQQVRFYQESTFLFDE